MKKTLFVIIALSLAASLAGCTSGNGRSISGTVYAPNGVDRIPGAEVYIPAAGGAPLAVMTLNAAGDDLFGDIDTALARTVTDSEGRFTLTHVPAGTVPLVISAGFFRKRIDVFEGSGEGAGLEAALTTLPSTSTDPSGRSARIALVTGNWDNTEEVLAKCGMGALDDYGCLSLGTETFDIYIGNHERRVMQPGVDLSPTLAEWPLEDYLGYWGLYGDWLYMADWPKDRYLTFGNLFSHLESMQKYDVIVLPCGAGPLLPEPFTWSSNPDIAFLFPFSDPAVVARLRDFVAGGGCLFVNDWSYQYVEQAFPGFIQFENEDSPVPFTPDNYGLAGVGLGRFYSIETDTFTPITYDVSVLDPALSAWLSANGALGEDGKVRFSDECDCFSVMNGAEAGPEGDQVRLLAEAPVYLYQLELREAGVDVNGKPFGSYMAPTSEYIQAVRPLVATFPYGAGKVIFTTIHPNVLPHFGLTPQERILQYLLLFETAP
jgi:hypothetical protein